MLADVDAFYASVEVVRDPRLRGRPVVVGGGPGDRGVVLSATYEARASGVSAAMPLGRARVLCPGATFLPPDFPAYEEASRRVLEVFRERAPVVEPVSLDEAFLDLTDAPRTRPTWLDEAEAIHAAVRERTGLSVSIGIGGTRAVAAVAAALAKPAGVLEVPRGEEAAFLRDLPVERLGGVGPRTREALATLGVHTIGDLARTPDARLEAVLGRAGPRLAARARGLDDGPVLAGPSPRRSLSRDASFPRDVRDPDVLSRALSFLAQRAAHALRREERLAGAVGVRLRYGDWKTVEARRRFPAPTDDEREVTGAVEALWRRRWDRTRPLRLVGVALHDLVGAGERQLALFEVRHDGGAAARSRADGRLGGSGDRSLDRTVDRVDRVVDRVRERHGFAALLRGTAIDGPGPRLAG
jgi:DNA polymerase-4